MKIIYCLKLIILSIRIHFVSVCVCVILVQDYELNVAYLHIVCI